MTELRFGHGDPFPTRLTGSSESVRCSLQKLVKLVSKKLVKLASKKLVKLASKKLVKLASKKLVKLASKKLVKLVEGSHGARFALTARRVNGGGPCPCRGRRLLCLEINRDELCPAGCEILPAAHDFDQLERP